MNAKLNVLLATTLAAIVSVGVAACEKKGPLEQAGEEADEAIDTIKNGGEESTSNKADDAIDEAREGVNDTADELKKD